MNNITETKTNLKPQNVACYILFLLGVLFWKSIHVSFYVTPVPYPLK